MEKSFMKREFLCGCGSTFLASRSDAKHCKVCHAERRAQWQKNNRHRRKAAHRKIREQAFAGYGGQCSCCGEQRFEFLAIVHVNGGGHKERMTKNTYQIARKVINLGFPPEYRVLCHNCNSAIGWYGYCPHQHEQLKRTA